MVSTLHEHAVFTGGPVFGGLHRLTTGVEAHAHDFLEIAVIGGGQGRHVSSRGDHALRHGDVVVLRPGAWHEFRDCADLTVANCCVSAQALRAELAALHEFPMLRRMLWTDPTTAGTHGVATTTIVPAAADEAKIGRAHV